ncbi:MAG: rhomboid family intramembrane serine protease [Bacteroidia bacterium]|nr:rhomboid family intramembrane serine protease [Bacteroidia bacterium]
MITYIIIATVALVTISAFNKREVYYKLMFNPYQVKHSNQWYRFISHVFIHADWNHVIFNMLTLFFFGVYVESAFSAYFGEKATFLYILEFVMASVVSSVPSYFKHKDNYGYNAVGASGAVSAILFTSILFDPLNKIYIFFIPIGIPAFIFGILYLAYSAYMSKKNVDNIGHDAHFWGAVFGFIFPLALKPELFIIFINMIKQNFGL